MMDVVQINQSASFMRKGVSFFVNIVNWLTDSAIFKLN